MFRKKDPEPTPATSMPSSPPPVATPLPTRAAPPAAASSPPPATSEAAAGKRLIVGQGLSLSGDITACDLLIVEGSVQVTLNDTKAIEITETGRFTNGKAAVEEATISGVYEGELTVRGRLLVRGTGRVDGRIRYGELEVERGGRLSGTIQILSEMSSSSAPAATQISRPVEPSLVGAEQG
jgi:cytoskeletal protein CcmA (bactofilin family)